MGGVYYMFSNRYKCPECGAEWKSKGCKDETMLCEKCNPTMVLPVYIFPYESEEVDYEEYD